MGRWSQISLYKRFQTSKSTRTQPITGAISIGFVVLVRLSGLLQHSEKLALDYGLRWRPPESPDHRVVIVGITENDIQQLETYPIPDKELAAILRKLQTYYPRVIGVDIFRDLPVEPGHSELIQTLSDMPNVVAIEKALPDLSGFTIPPPPNLPETQVGFVDALLDEDGFVRRSLLGATSSSGDYRFSLTIRLAETYLAAQNITLENGIKDPIAMRFGSTELTQFQPNTGGYIQSDAGGNQMLINFRSGPNPFRIISLEQLKSGQVNPKWFEDRIVLVGIMALSQKDIINTAAISGSNPDLVYGVEVQAHAVSQIISAVLDNRPLLTAWPDIWEYLWILVWGLMGIWIGQLTPSPTKHFLLVSCISLGMIGLGYVGLMAGIWLPIVPGLLVFGLNGVVLYGFYLYDQGLKLRIRDRQKVIEDTFQTIHNGPLQTLANILRHTADQDWPPSAVHSHLQHLNQELRQIYEVVRLEALNQSQQVVLSDHLSLDLGLPLQELLYEVYKHTIERDFPCFQNLKLKVVKFEAMDSQNLTMDLTRDLCRFLEETLCNVGKYAERATRLTVTCMQKGNQNLISVADNGFSDESTLSIHASAQLGGRGTQQANDLAKRLGGTFSRRANPPQGIICEISWPVKKSKKRRLQWLNFIQ